MQRTPVGPFAGLSKGFRPKPWHRGKRGLLGSGASLAPLVRNWAAGDLFFPVANATFDDQSHIDATVGTVTPGVGLVTLSPSSQVRIQGETLPQANWWAYSEVENYAGGNPSYRVRMRSPDYNNQTTGQTRARSGSCVWHLPDAHLSTEVNLVTTSLAGTFDLVELQMVDMTKYFNDPWDIWLVAGQSNMTGREVTGAHDPAVDGWFDQRMLYWPGITNNQHQAEVDRPMPIAGPLQMELASDGVSPAIRFAQRMVGTLGADRSLMLVAAADGGTGLVGEAAEWNPAGSNPVAYNHLRDRALACLAAAPAGSVIRGMLWGQGESDTTSDMSAYGPAFAAMRAQLVADLNLTGDFPVLCIGSPPDRDHIHQSFLLAYQAGMASDSGEAWAQPLFWYADRPSGYIEADLLHATAEGNRLAGDLLANLGLEAVQAHAGVVQNPPPPLPALAMQAAFIEEMSFSGGRFTGFSADLVDGATPLGVTIGGVGPLGDAVNGIDHGSIGGSIFYQMLTAQFPVNGTAAWVIFFEDKAAYTTGMISNSNTSDFIGAAEASGGLGSPVNNASYAGLIGRGGTLGADSTHNRLAVWNTVFGPADTIKYAAVRGPGQGQPSMPLQYPGGGGGPPAAYTPNVYVKGYIVFPATDWANVQDYIDYGLWKLGG